MHITVDHASFQEILDLAARISTRHITLPVLQCVLLSAEEGTLTVRATNLEIAIEGAITARVTKEGSAAVSAATLREIVALISEKEVTLRLDGEHLSVETGSSHSKIATLPTDEFPSIPRLTTGGKAIPGKLFAEGIRTAAFAASVSSIKPELGSVYVFQKKQETLTFVATDSFRLVEKTLPAPSVILTESMLIPAKNALELARVAEAQGGTPTLYQNENQCALSYEHVYVTSRLTSGTFPDYQEIIPKEYQTHATALTADLVAALKKTSIFLNKFMQLTVEVKGNTLTLVSKGDAGTTTETLKVATEGSDILLNFNQRYIGEILPFVVDDSIQIHFAGIGRPIVMENVHDRSLRYLVMPMNK